MKTLLVKLYFKTIDSFLFLACYGYENLLNLVNILIIFVDNFEIP